MGATDSLYAYAHRPKAILSASWDGLFALLGGRNWPGLGIFCRIASHDALRDAGVLLCFFGQFDLWSFQQRTTKSGRPAKSDRGGPGHMLDRCLHRGSG